MGEGEQPQRLGPEAVVIKTLMSDQGIAIVGIQVPSTNLIIMPDAAAEIALQLLGAAYAARSEDALHKAMREKGLE